MIKKKQVPGGKKKKVIAVRKKRTAAIQSKTAIKKAKSKIPKVSKRAEVQRAFEETIKKYGKVFSELSKL